MGLTACIVTLGLLLAASSARCRDGTDRASSDAARAERDAAEPAAESSDAGQLSGPLYALADRAAELVRRSLELRRMYGPELAYTWWSSSDEFEDIRRHILAVGCPVSDRLRMAVVAENADYRVDGFGEESAELNSLEVRGEYRLNPRLDAVAALMPYTGDASAVGALLGLEYSGREDTRLSVTAEGWQPWRENTLSVDGDGRRHGIEARASLPFTDRLSLELDAGADLYRLGSDRAGSSNEAGVRAEYVFYREPEVTMGSGFMDSRLRRDDGMVLQVSGHVAARRKRYHLASDFTAVPVIPRSMEYTVGLDAQVPLNRHWGVALGGFAGRDSEREIHFPNLNGGSLRLVFVPSDQVRGWVGYHYISESRTGFEGGRTGIWTAGLNVNF